MLFTLPFVTFGLFRYLFLLNKSEQAEAPEQLIIQDIPVGFINYLLGCGFDPSFIAKQLGY